MNGEMLKLKVKTSTGAQYDLEVEATSTVEEVKKLLEPQSSIPADQQRLIYSGHILKNENTLGSYCTSD